MSEQDDKDRRAQMFVRFMLDNVGGFLSFAGVIFAAGILYGKFETVDNTVNHISAQQDIQSADLHTVKTDIAVLKTQVTTIEKNQARR